MAVLRSSLDPDAPATRANADAMRALVADLRARTDALTRDGAGGDERSIARHRERGKLPVRERIDRLLDPGSAFLELSTLAATDLYDGDAPGAGIVTGIGQVEGVTCVVVANDADREGRHLLPDDGEEAPPRAGDRAREPAAVPLPGRQRRRLPAAPGRGLPRSRALRPDLLQPGPAVGARRPAGRAGHGLLHRRRRLRAGHERRDGDRQGHRHDLPGRSAAGPGGDRRGRHGRGARRRRGPHDPVRRRRPLRAGRRARAGHRPRDRAPPGLAQPEPPWEVG